MAPIGKMAKTPTIIATLAASQALKSKRSLSLAASQLRGASLSVQPT